MSIGVRAGALMGAAAVLGIASAGPASAGAGGPYENAISIISITPSPAQSGTPVEIFVQERNDTGVFIPFTVSGPCIAPYTFVPNGDALPFAYKGSFNPSVMIASDFVGQCTITINGNGLTDSKTFDVTAPSKPKPVVNTTSANRADDTFDAAAASRSGVLPTQQASVTVQASSVVVAETPASATARVAGVSVTNTGRATLPRTGSSSIEQAWLGAGLAAIGGFFVVVARRRVRHATIRSRYLR